MYDYTKQTYVEVGDKFETEMPHSEVCMSMQVAGKVMGVALYASEGHGAVAQLYTPETGHPYSAPILVGEAGVYRDGERYYYYPVDCGMNEFLGGEDDLNRNWANLLDSAGLTEAERGEAQAAFERRITRF